MPKLLIALISLIVISGCSTTSSGKSDVVYTYQPLLTEFPEASNPPLSDFVKITKVELVKGKFEKSEDFQDRKKQVHAARRQQLEFFVPLRIGYNADVEAYLVKSCTEEMAIHNRTNKQLRSSYTDHELKEVWPALEVHEIVVDAGVCTTYEIPYELSKAQAIDGQISALAKVVVPQQAPRKLYRGKRPVEIYEMAFATYKKTFVGGVSQIYLGSPSLGVISAWDLGNPNTHFRMRCLDGYDLVRALLA